MPETDKKGVIKLTAEDKKKLQALQSDIERGEKGVKALKEMGIETKELEEKIGWAKKAREVLLRDFT